MTSYIAWERFCNDEFLGLRQTFRLCDLISKKYIIKVLEQRNESVIFLLESYEDLLVISDFKIWILLGIKKKQISRTKFF